jgi:hypothetical protein
MFVFSCFILFYIAAIGYKYTQEYIKEYTEHLTKHKELENKYNINKNNKLSTVTLERIKYILLSPESSFPVSQNLLLQENSYFNSNIILNLLNTYKNVQEWHSTDLGDVLYIINLKPMKTTRSYSKNIKCFHILLDEFIYYVYNNLKNEHIKFAFKNHYNNLKIIILSCIFPPQFTECIYDFSDSDFSDFSDCY